MAETVLILTGKKQKTTEDLMNFLRTGDTNKEEAKINNGLVALGMWIGIAIYALSNLK